MSLRSRANYVSKMTGEAVHVCEQRINQIGKDSADLAKTAKIPLKEADLRLILERFQVVCSICSMPYGLGITATQGAKCSGQVIAHMDQLYIWAHYGSEFDGDLFLLAPAADLLYLVRDDNGRLPNPVCDWCIRQLLKNGHGELYKENCIWELPWSGG
jgi:hypothetical protein